MLSMAAYSMGSRGILLCIAGVFPHFLFYIPAYLVLVWYAIVYPQNRWNRQKTIFIVLMLAILLCIAGVFPHFLFYIPAYLVLVWYAIVYPQNRWNRQKTIFIVLMLAMGLVLEGFVNPVLMRMFVKMM